MIRIMTDGVIPNTQNKKYIIETASELSQLEAVFGNEAYCIGNETTYICNGSGTYVVKKNVGENELPYVTQSDNGTLLEVADGVWGKGANANEIARVDGHYENLGAGRADQLVSTTFAEDSVPYSFRTSGGSADVGDLEYDEIVGGTIAWNQLIQNGNFASATNWSRNRCVLTVDNNVGHFVCNSDEYASWGFYKNNNCTVGHKLLALGSFCCHTTNPASSLQFASSGNRIINLQGYTTQSDPQNDVWYNLSFIGIYNETSATVQSVLSYSNRTSISVDSDYVDAKNIMLFDLTQMFGPDIADYIYSLEAETTGNGIAYFRKLFPNAYYTTDTGTLMSVKAASHKMIGFNAWDEVWENGSISGSTGADTNNGNTSYVRSKNFIKVFPDTKYFIKSTYETHIMYYDHNKNFIGLFDANRRGTFQNQTSGVERIPPDGCGYIRFYIVASTYNNDICINLWWSGYRNGEYEAHKERVYPLDSSLELQGVLKIDSLNRVYYDGDSYKSDGTVIRRYHEVSSVDCSIGAYDAASARWYLAIPNTAPDIVPSLTTEVGKIRTSKYFTTIHRTAISASTKYCITHRDYDTAYSSRQFVFTIDPDIVSTVEEARTWVTNHPFNIIYECVESVENAAAFISPQWVDDFGTEEYVDYGVQQGDRDVSIPVGHNTKYLQNLRDKLQHLPDLPDPLSDGDYKIRVNNYQMSLIPDGGVESVFYDYTPTASEQAAIMNAFQAFLVAGIQNAGSPTYYHASGDFTSLSNAVIAAYNSGKLFRMRFLFSENVSYIVSSTVYGLNDESSAVAASIIPYLGNIPGVEGMVSTVATTLTFATSIEISGTVFIA